MFIYSILHVYFGCLDLPEYCSADTHNYSRYERWIRLKYFTVSEISTY